MTDTDAHRSTEPATTDRNRPQQLADEDELDAFCAAADVALVEFYTNGCGLCHSMKPVLGNLARALDISVGLINPRDDPPLIERFDVRSVPLLVLFIDGEPVARKAEDFVSGDELTDWIHQETNRER